MGFTMTRIIETHSVWDNYPQEWDKFFSLLQEEDKVFLQEIGLTRDNVATWRWKDILAKLEANTAVLQLLGDVFKDFTFTNYGAKA